MRELVTMAKNVTRQFEPQGECDSSYPTLDGSCRNKNDDGRSMATYKRLVPANYCDQKQYPRCRQGNFSDCQLNYLHNEFLDFVFHLLIFPRLIYLLTIKFQFFSNVDFVIVGYRKSFEMLLEEPKKYPRALISQV